MPNYLYNGIELPDINTVWTDKEAYPYAVLNYNKMNIDGNWWTAELFLYSEPIIYYDEMVDDYIGYTYGGSGDWMIYVATDNPALAELYLGDKWGGLEPGVWGFHSSGKADGIDEINVGLEWTSHDILNSVNGSIYLAASKPISVATESEYFDLDSWLIGFAMGLANESLPLGIAEEVSE